MTRSDAEPKKDFTPAIPLLQAYDLIVALFTREKFWRNALLRQLNPQSSDVIADAGCGTASFLVLVGNHVKPQALIGVDPDTEILKMAQQKLLVAHVNADLRHGYLRTLESVLAASGVNKIVSSLVFHQVPLEEKRAGLDAIFAALAPGGELHIADFGLQRTRLMRTLFKMVQMADGFDDTQPNADGMLPQLIAAAGFVDVVETMVVPTVFGSISLYRGVKPGGVR